MKLVKFTKKGIYCIPGKFYLDPWYPVDYAIISHGHADHSRWGNKHYLCHTHSKHILLHRLGKDISLETMGYNQSKSINGVKVSFFPAGHIIGSAQIRLEYKGKIVVFSGDYKTQPDFITTAFEPVKCHEFITESTFGLPIYNWKAEKDLQTELQNWVVQNQANNRTSVFLGYSLGKAQRIMSLVNKLDTIFVHSAIYNLNEAISKSGIYLPEATRLDPNFNKETLQNKIVIMPPGLLGSKLLKRIPNASTAICSGWMQIRGNRRWKGVDAGFAVSDHADWNGLLSAVKATQAEKVYVTHGSEATFSKYLNSIGINSEEVKTEYGTEEDEEHKLDSELNEENDKKLSIQALKLQ